MTDCQLLLVLLAEWLEYDAPLAPLSMLYLALAPAGL